MRPPACGADSHSNTALTGTSCPNQRKHHKRDQQPGQQSCSKSTVIADRGMLRSGALHIVLDARQCVHCTGICRNAEPVIVDETNNQARRRISLCSAALTKRAFQKTVRIARCTADQWRKHQQQHRQRGQVLHQFGKGRMK